MDGIQKIITHAALSFRHCERSEAIQFTFVLILPTGTSVSSGYKVKRGDIDCNDANECNQNRSLILRLIYCEWETSSKIFQVSHLQQPKVQTITAICDRF